MDEVLTEDRLIWAVNSFKPFKSPGKDGIFPAVLQKCLDLISVLLLGIYRLFLERAAIPELWREVLVIFIPKAGKALSK